MLCPLLTSPWREWGRISRHLLNYRGENLGVYSLLKMQKVSPTHMDSLLLLVVFLRTVRHGAAASESTGLLPAAPFKLISPKSVTT